MGLLMNRDEPRAEAESLLELLARANHLLAESFNDQVKRHGLSVTEWRILAALVDHDGSAMTELADRVMFKQPTLTKAIDRMERAKLVERNTPAEDRRRTLVQLTERGRRTVTPLLQRARQHESAVESALGEALPHELRVALSLLIDRLAELPREPQPNSAARLRSAASRG